MCLANYLRAVTLFCMSRTLFRSVNLHVFASEHTAAGSNRLVVCSFQNRVGQPDLDSAGFGEKLLADAGIAGVFFNCATNHWWQYPEMPQALSVVRRFTSGYETCATYGSSMGAYAAIRFAEAIGATRVVASGPQFSPRSSVVGREKTYDNDVKDVIFLFEDNFRAKNESTVYLIYDPFLLVDKEHADLYAEAVTAVRVPIACSGHPPLALLAEQGRAKTVTLELLQGRFVPEQFHQEQRALRRGTFRYWEQLGYRLAERGRMPWASRVAERAATVLPSRHDEAMALALRWAWWRSDFARAKFLSGKLPVGHPEVKRMEARLGQIQLAALQKQDAISKEERGC